MTDSHSPSDSSGEIFLQQLVKPVYRVPTDRKMYAKACRRLMLDSDISVAKLAVMIDKPASWLEELLKENPE